MYRAQAASAQKRRFQITACITLLACVILFIYYVFFQSRHDAASSSRVNYWEDDPAVIKREKLERGTMPVAGGDQHFGEELWVQLPSRAFQMHRRMHSHAGGKVSTNAPNRFFLLHGASRVNQSGVHFSKHFEWLAQRGRFYSMDLIGHGMSLPGPAHKMVGLDAIDQVLALSYFVNNVPGEDFTKLVVVGRSFGGKVALEFAKHEPHRIAALVLIAPAVSGDYVNALPVQVRSLPVLFVWDENDPVIPHANLDLLRSAFLGSTYVANLPPIDDPHAAHFPEIVRPKDFQVALDDFLSKINSAAQPGR